MKHNKLIKFCLCLILGAILCVFLVSKSNAEDKWRLDFTYGTCSGCYNNIYVIWAENPDVGFYYPIYVCNRLRGIGGTLYAIACPYWKINKYPLLEPTEYDAVTGATIQKQDFSVPFELPADAPDEFTLYFETDVYYNANDWFYRNQPAILYKTEIDRNNLQTEYTLEFVGWTPNDKDVSDEIAHPNIAELDLVLGTLESETRYITNLKDKSYTTSDVFLGYDARAQSDGIVGSIKVIPSTPPRKKNINFIFDLLFP
jgi:hypothetical protein